MDPTSWASIFDGILTVLHSYERAGTVTWRVPSEQFITNMNRTFLTRWTHGHGNETKQACGLLVCGWHGQHLHQRIDQTDRVWLLIRLRGQLNRGKCFFPGFRLRLRIYDVLINTSSIADGVQKTKLLLYWGRFKRSIFFFLISKFPKIMKIYMRSSKIVEKKLGRNWDTKTWRQFLPNFYHPLQVRRPRRVRAP